MRSLLLISILHLFLLLGVQAGFPPKIYGVDLGSWLVLESWMLPAEWLAMGGQQCDDCSTCIASEFAFAEAFPDTVDEKFNTHWNTWFNQPDVDQFVELGLNTVRIPLGYWIVEALVDRETEFFPRGGLSQLRRGLQQLAKANIVAILDHHALPGVQDALQQFTGRCTTDVQFYTPNNYHRALVWSAVMTALSHLDPAFSAVVAIEAVNEPIMDSTMTPGYGDSVAAAVQKNFVGVVRAMEFLLGLPVPGVKSQASAQTGANITAAVNATLPPIFNTEVQSAIDDAIPILIGIGQQLSIKEIAIFRAHSKAEPLITTFMDINWQQNNPPNPADAALGPQIYDNHLYYSFGGVADPNEIAYLTSICNLNRIQADAALSNDPLIFGEWGLPTQFQATDQFLVKWADAQKRAYSMGAGWIFWNFKIEISEAAGDTARQWSYVEGVKRGYLTKDPAVIQNASVCDPFITSS